MSLLRRKGLFESTKVLFLPIAAISPNPDQPRTCFSREGLEELAASIQELGVLQPLSVRRSKNGGYELISGERRLRASRMAGLTEVPCILVSVDSQGSSLLALVENLQRRDLNFVEEATALAKLIETYHLSQEEAARRIGKSQSAVAQQAAPAPPPARCPHPAAGARLHRAPRPGAVRLEEPGAPAHGRPACGRAGAYCGPDGGVCGNPASSGRQARPKKTNLCN